MVEASILVSAAAGAGSFLSPCILPIMPAFISYLSGTTVNELQSTGGQSLAIKRSTRINIFLNTVYFVLGFSLVFAVLGVILNSLLINIGTSFQATFQTIG